jgi:transcription initiation factor IIE alpha subunit
MMDKSGTTKEKKQPGYMCELCRCRVPKEEATKIDYFHCGRKMTEMEVIYMSDPSPSGP